MSRPQPAEYDPYYEKYIFLVPEEDIIATLKRQTVDLSALFENVDEEKSTFAYADGKWTIKEILVHIIDDERIYVYRALRFARKDSTELPGFEQDDYALYSEAGKRSIENIFEEYEAVRNSTIALFNGLPENSFLRSGTANNNKATVRALAYHIAGHELHHINIIKEKYLQL